MKRAEALALLGLDEGFGDTDLRRARRFALLAHHPDHGGSREAVDAVERAVGILLREGQEIGAAGAERGRRGSDHPSFTVNALPVEAFELLLLVSAELGDVSDDDPPYRLEVRMYEPLDTWVSFEIVPDAGSSTVSMIVEGRTALDTDEIRDVWISAINAAQMP